MRPVDARLRFRRARFRPAPQPLNFCVNAILQRLLPLRLRVQEFFLLDQERAVIPMYAQNAIGVSAIELGHLRGHIFQKIAIMADGDAGKRCTLQ